MRAERSTTDRAGRGVAVKRYVIELRVREAGDVPGLPIAAVVEVPGRSVRRGHETLGAAVDWALREIQTWMRRDGE